ncbi:YihY/virulence factor BrkB family protein, partial [Streptomyces sp. 12297]
EANERVREAEAAQLVARAAAWRALAEGESEDDEDSGMPSEFPERWSNFLPPDDYQSRLRKHTERHPH